MMPTLREYEKLADVENKHWWFRILHLLVYREIRNSLPPVENPRILDAGCGTGGMMHYLKNRLDATIIEGYDISEAAVEYCKSKGLNAQLGSHVQIESIAKSNKYDVVICNDSFYYLTDSEQKKFLMDLYSLLKPGGLLIMNLIAFRCMAGIHDLSVGIYSSDQRTSLKEFRSKLKGLGFNISSSRYWPFLLSPVIFLIRLKQRISLKWNPDTVIESDIDLPMKFINLLLYRLTSLELKLFKSTFFGSSLFVSLKRI